MLNPAPALILCAATIGAAWSLPRWRSLPGFSGELVALTALIAMQTSGVFPAVWFPGRTVELIVVSYAFIRVQKLWAAAPDPENPVMRNRVELSAPSRWAWFDRVPAAKNAHLLAFSAWVLGSSVMGSPADRWSSSVMPLLMGLMAIGGRRAAALLVALPFIGGITYLTIWGG